MAYEDPDPDLKEGKQKDNEKTLDRIYQETLEEIKSSLEESESSYPVFLGEDKMIIAIAKNLCLKGIYDSFSRPHKNTQTTLSKISKKIEEAYGKYENNGKELSDEEKVKLVAYADALVALGGRLEEKYGSVVKETKEYLEKQGFKPKPISEITRYLLN